MKHLNYLIYDQGTWIMSNPSITSQVLFFLVKGSRTPDNTCLNVFKYFFFFFFKSLQQLYQEDIWVKELSKLFQWLPRASQHDLGCRLNHLTGFVWEAEGNGKTRMSSCLDVCDHKQFHKPYSFGVTWT